MPRTTGGYEHKSQPLATRKVFLQRVYRNVRLASALLLGCLLIGVMGYRFTAPMGWIDALHNASITHGGLGP
jgi:hypothetical protein